METGFVGCDPTRENVVLRLRDSRSAGGVLLQPGDVDVTRKRDVKREELSRTRDGRGSWIGPAMDFGVAIGKSEAGSAIVVCGGVIDEIPGTVRVIEEAAIVDAFFAFIEDDPQVSGGRSPDGIDLTIELVDT